MIEKLNTNITELKKEVWAIGVLQLLLIRRRKMPGSGFAWMEFTETKKYKRWIEKIKNLKK